MPIFGDQSDSTKCVVEILLLTPITGDHSCVQLSFHSRLLR